MTQRLHLVFGGELKDPTTKEFRDSDNIDMVGIFPNYDLAYSAWKAKAHQTVDNAHTRYFMRIFTDFVMKASQPALPKN